MMMEAKNDFNLTQLFDEAIRMHINLVSQINSIQLVKPNLSYTFKLLQNPSTQTVTDMSLLVFLKRFIPSHPISLSDSSVIYRYLGVNKQDSLPYFYFVRLIYPEGI